MLGEFEIEERLGAGGMGEVWRARHLASDTPVAIKVIHTRSALDDRALRSFRREIHAVASLSHPGITRILDIGTVPEDHPTLHPNSPWFAMNVAQGGGFSVGFVEDFGDLARLAFDLLDALAYAHARGIIHRDIKPENILLDGDEDRGYRPILTDFGLAFVLDPDDVEPGLEETEHNNRVGTPRYMAPEQFHGDWRSFGPWTDLYSLGCVLWQIASGHPPFQGTSMLETAMLHFSEPLPDLSPRFDVPDGFLAWLRRLSTKARHERFQWAADASWALYGLIGRDQRWQPSAALRVDDPAEEDAWMPTLTMSGETAELSSDDLAEVLRNDRISQTEPLPIVKPPVPGLVAEAGDSVTPGLRGVGLNLFGLRAVPLVDRNHERKTLWDTFKRSTRGNASLIVVEGASGVGKSHLSEWLTTRAAELGAGRPITVRHNPSASGAHGLGHAIRVLIHGVDLHGEGLFHRIEDFIEPLVDDARARADRSNEIYQLLAAEPPRGFPKVVFESPGQRYFLIGWLFSRLAHERPLLVFLENAQWASDSLAFVQTFLENHGDSPVTFIAALTPESCGDLEAERIDALLRGARAQKLHILPLDRRFHQRLVQSLVPVDDAAAVRIARFGKGRPGEIIQIISDLLANDELVAAEDGFSLAPSSRLSGEFEDVWTLTTNRLRSKGGDVLIVALEIGAALGNEVVLSEWRELCARLGADSSEDFIELAVANGAIERIESGWAFQSPRLAERLKEKSIESGRWRKIHEVAASIEFEQVPGHSLHARRAYHLGEAGLDDEAQAEMRLATRELLVMSDYGRAANLARILDDWLAESGVTRDDPRRVEAMTLRIDALRFRGALEAAIEAKRGLEHRVPGCSDPIARADAYRAFGNLDYLVADRQKAFDWYDAAFDACPEDAHLLSAKLHHGVAWFHSNTPRLDEAMHHYEKAAEHARECDAGLELGWALHGIADIQTRISPPGNSELADEAARVFEEHGSRTGWAAATTVRGDFARIRGDFEVARALYEEAIETLSHVGSILEAVARGRLAILCFVEGDHEAALEEGRRGAALVESAFMLPIRALPELLLAVVEPDDEIARKHFELGRELRESSGYVHPDLEMLWAKAALRFT